jgi:hypothetical protein
MYQALDAFLAKPTWYTNRPVERRRFFLALDAIVRHPAFEAEALADHIVHRTGDRRLHHVARQLAAEAQSVRDFLIATGSIVPR